ncbi:hypothetical protein PENTCL1PPCAC_29878, partial [Pristionchus entomophagus]
RALAHPTEAVGAPVALHRVGAPISHHDIDGANLLRWRAALLIVEEEAGLAARLRLASLRLQLIHCRRGRCRDHRRLTNRAALSVDHLLVHATEAHSLHASGSSHTKRARNDALLERVGDARFVSG